MSHRVHRYDIRMTRDQRKFERFLNGLSGEVVAIVPNVSVHLFRIHRVDFLVVVEKV